jgi:hypothetical protein
MCFTGIFEAFLFSDLFQGWFSSSCGRDRKLLLIGTATLFWTFWETRNKSCFLGMGPGDPTNVVLYLCHLLNEWEIWQKNKSYEDCYNEGLVK